MQLYRSGKFRKYDFGRRNVEIYGTFEPPDYILSNVKIPTYLYRATEDYLASRWVCINEMCQNASNLLTLTIFLFTGY